MGNITQTRLFRSGRVGLGQVGPAYVGSGWFGSVGSGRFASGWFGGGHIAKSDNYKKRLLCMQTAPEAVGPFPANFEAPRTIISRRVYFLDIGFETERKVGVCLAISCWMRHKSSARRPVCPVRPSVSSVPSVRPVCLSRPSRPSVPFVPSVRPVPSIPSVPSRPSRPSVPSVPSKGKNVFFFDDKSILSDDT